MTNPISTSTVRADLMAIESSPRPTPAPPRVSFRQTLASVGGVASRTAQAAVGSIPGSSIVATALRGPAVPLELGPTHASVRAPAISTAADGLSSSSLATGGDVTADAQAALAQGQDTSMAMLRLQCEVAEKQNTFTTLSNVLKSESDTEKAAINNIK